MRAGPQGQSPAGSGQPPHPALLPVVGEGVEVGHLHGAGIRLVAELVNQQPLLSLPDHAYLEEGDTLRPARLVGLRCSVPRFSEVKSCPWKVLIPSQGSPGGPQMGSPPFQALKHDFKHEPRPSCIRSCWNAY